MIAVRELDLDGRPARAAQLDQRPHGLHPRLRLRRGLRQRGPPTGRPVVLSSRHPAAGRARRVRAADLLRRGVADLQHRRRPEGRRRRARLPRRRGGAGQSQHHLPGQGRRRRSARLFRKLLFATQVPGGQHPALRPGQPDSQILYDRDPQDAGREGRALADPGRRPLPGGGRRPDPVDRRRLHHDQRLPVLHAQHARRRDHRLADDHASRAGDAGATQVNYIRNSVKATVDAYDGTVTLYEWDDRGPGAARPGRRRSPAR